jgi:hypothetical protein
VFPPPLRDFLKASLARKSAPAFRLEPPLGGIFVVHSLRRSAAGIPEQ